jgi:hypothetical protein
MPDASASTGGAPFRFPMALTPPLPRPCSARVSPCVVPGHDQAVFGERALYVCRDSPALYSAAAGIDGQQPERIRVSCIQGSEHFMRLFLPTVCVAVVCMAGTGLTALERPRLAVLTDIGGDPDDQQSMIRLMVYANEFDIELLIASAAGTPGELKESITRTDLIHQIIDAYGEVLPNLQRHADGWPAARTLHALVISGNPLRGREHIGASHDTRGSRALIDRIDAGAPERPLNIAIWGGQTDFAQALWRVKQDRGTAGLAAFVRRFRVYDIADQDGVADWMRTEFPGMSYILAKAPAGRDRREAVFRGMYLTGDESLTSRAWIDEHVRSRGPLGGLYPTKTWTAPNPHGAMKEGDTPRGSSFCHSERTIPPIRLSPAGADSSCASATAGFAIHQLKPEKIRAKE